MPNNTSPSGQLNMADVKSIGRGLVITLSGAAITYLGPVLLGIHYVFNVNGNPVDFTPIVVVMLSAIINTARKWVTSHETPTV